MKKFFIDNVQLSIEDRLYPSPFTVQSHPQNYEVVFDSFNNMEFTHDQVVLIDSNVKQRYNINHDKIIEIKAIEQNKTIYTVLDICSKLIQFNFNKGNQLVVIGGGIVQDIGSYAAKTFKRGIDWVCVPTTLLSQCDSCIGGKTALNFDKYKNQLALFSAPSKVIIDINFIDTLTEKDKISGMGEIVKLLIIGGYDSVHLSTLPLHQSIYTALLIKKAVIEHDEFETNIRKSLNYGHSFGHAIEAITSYSIPHGESVLLGIDIVNKLTLNIDTITNIINRYTSLNKLKNIVTARDLIQYTKTDKKVKGDVISLVVIPRIGVTEFINVKLDQHLEDKLNAVLTN